MDYVKRVLISEGFADPSPLQVWKGGQVFGLVKAVGRGLEMHVRGYADSSLDSEIELSRDYLEHPYDCKPYYGPLLEILTRNGVPFTIRGPLPSDPITVSVPERPTPWKPLAAIGGIALAAIAISWVLDGDDD